jgi:hypothetical protein
MPNKKAGGRIAASQAKAKERAKRKGRGPGPAIPSTAYTTPLEQHDVEATPLNADEGSVETAAVSREHAPVAAAPVAASERRLPAAARRHRTGQAAPFVPGLRRELITIGSITAVIGVMLVVLKTGTDLGV